MHIGSLKLNLLIIESLKVCIFRIFNGECLRLNAECVLDLMIKTCVIVQAEESSIRTHLVQCEHEKARVLGHLMENSDSIQDDSRL
mgnify:CR=1 FL=1